MFYNGTQEQPERSILKLSDVFHDRSGSIDLELKVTMLNVNMGRNHELMEQCRTLKEYAIYVDKVRKYSACMETGAAVRRAVDECIREDVLRDFLTRHRAEAIQMSIFEYNEEKEMRLIREAERLTGFEEGEVKGELKTLTAMIRKKYQNGKSFDEIVETLELDNSFVEYVVKMLKQDEVLTDDEIVNILIKNGINS